MQKVRNDDFIKQFIKDPLYKVDENGICWSLRSKQGHITSNWREIGYDKDGYLRFRYKGKSLFCHRISYIFNKGDLNGMDINHIDGNKSNNHPENLEPCTQAENNLHSYRVLGRKPILRKGCMSLENAEKIRKDYLGGLSLNRIKEKYKISKSTASYIINYRTYSVGYSKEIRNLIEEKRKH